MPRYSPKKSLSYNTTIIYIGVLQFLRECDIINYIFAPICRFGNICKFKIYMMKKYDPLCTALVQGRSGCALMHLRLVILRR